MLFRMVPKPEEKEALEPTCFRVMLFRMVPKLTQEDKTDPLRFRVMLFRMVPKPKLVRLLKN